LQLPKNLNRNSQSLNFDLLNKELKQNGYLKLSFIDNNESNKFLKNFVQKKLWQQIDQRIFELTKNHGRLFNLLQNFSKFTSIEHILSLRDSTDPDQEDGIWHDDGSRVLAFSLSLTLNPINGGELLLRKKNEINYQKIVTPEFGDLLIFLTGTSNWEHKIQKVTKGARLVVAGWCS